MSLLQSALDFLAGPGSLGGAAARDQTDFVGQTVEMGELRLRVRRVLAEGEGGRGRSGGDCGGRGRPRVGHFREGGSGPGRALAAVPAGAGHPRPGRRLARRAGLHAAGGWSLQAGGAAGAGEAVAPLAPRATAGGRTQGRPPG